jgi:hypothetical protein
MEARLREGSGSEGGVRRLLVTVGALVALDGDEGFEAL